MGTVNRCARRCFSRAVACVRVPAPGQPVDPLPVRRPPTVLVDALVRGAAALAAAGSLAVLTAWLPGRTVLRDDLASIARDRAWERYLPDWDQLRGLLADPDERRVLP